MECSFGGRLKSRTALRAAATQRAKPVLEFNRPPKSCSAKRSMTELAYDRAIRRMARRIKVHPQPRRIDITSVGPCRGARLDEHPGEEGLLAERQDHRSIKPGHEPTDVRDARRPVREGDIQSIAGKGLHADRSE